MWEAGDIEHDDPVLVAPRLPQRVDLAGAIPLQVRDAGRCQVSALGRLARFALLVEVAASLELSGCELRDVVGKLSLHELQGHALAVTVRERVPEAATIAHSS